MSNLYNNKKRNFGHAADGNLEIKL